MSLLCGVKADFFFVSVDIGNAFFHPLGRGRAPQVVVEILPGPAREIFGVGAAAEVVKLAIVAPKPGRFVIASQRKEQLDPLIPRHGVVGVVMEDQ